MLIEKMYYVNEGKRQSSKTPYNITYNKFHMPSNRVYYDEGET